MRRTVSASKPVPSMRKSVISKPSFAKSAWRRSILPSYAWAVGQWLAVKTTTSTFAEAKLAALTELLPKDVAKAEADVTRYEASVALAHKDMARQRELLKEKISSQEATDQAQEKLAVAEAQREAARKTLELVRAQYAENRKQAQAELDRDRAALTNAEVLLSYAVITAPISGVIGSVSTQEGETVAAGLNAPTFVTIIDLARLQVEAYVDEVDIGKVKLGLRAVFTVDAFPADDFEGKVVAIHPGPVVTTFEFAPEAGVRYSKVVGLVDDLCLGLKAESIRIDRIPGRSTVGIEVPNRHQEVIFPRELMASEKFRNTKSKLTLALGKDINGDVFTASAHTKAASMTSAVGSLSPYNNSSTGYDLIYGIGGNGGSHEFHARVILHQPS